MLKKFDLNIEPEALEDIQKAVDWYNNEKPGLGEVFFKAVDKHFSFLKSNYTACQVRYDDIHCMKVKNFPYMVHYRIMPESKTVSIKAVFHTHRSPNIWQERTK